MSAPREGEYPDLPLGYIRLVQCARAMVDGLKFDPDAGVLVIASDLLARRDDLDVMTDAAEREITHAREAGAT